MPSSRRQPKQQKFNHWAQRQIQWLESQISTAEELKSILQQKPIDEVESLVSQHASQNKQLDALIKEYDIIQKELQLSEPHYQPDSEVVSAIKKLVEELIKINNEIYQIVLKQQEKLLKEMESFFPLKNRFNGYNPQDKTKTENLNYDV